MKKIIQHILISVIAIAGLLAPKVLHAMSFSVNTEQVVHAKDIFVINVSIDTEKENINTVEGELSLVDSTQNFEVRDIVVAGSGLTMWPRRPSLSVKGDAISFTGGIPGGVSGNVQLFKIIVFARNPSELRITPQNIVTYLNDGKGTALTVHTKDSIITVQPALSDPIDQWRTIISTDNIAPEVFEISLYQDPSLYGGKKFLSFPTVDNQSGIAYYEVQEGGSLPVRTGDQYVLVNQDKIEDVSVIAYDVAGNARAGVYKGKRGINWYAVIVWTIILACIAKWRYVLRLLKKLKRLLLKRRK